jgi:hypothetical protein
VRVQPRREILQDIERLSKKSKIGEEHYVSYTSLKIVHDRHIQETMEQSRLSAGKAMQRHGLLRMLPAFFARFTLSNVRR